MTLCAQPFLLLAIFSAFLPAPSLNLLCTQNRKHITESDTVLPDPWALFCPLLTAREEEEQRAGTHYRTSKHRQCGGSNFRNDCTLLAAKLQPHLDGNQIVGVQLGSSTP